MKIIKAGAICGISVWLVGLLMCCFAGFAYVGYQEEGFSSFNHFISELGDAKANDLAWVFNYGLQLIGVLVLGFIVGLGFYLDSKLGWVTALFGASTGISGLLVGFYSVVNMKMHIRSAMGCFFGSLITLLLFSISVLISRKSESPKPWFLAIFAMVSFILLAVFLALPLDEVIKLVKNPRTYARPAFWLNAILEWLSVGAIILWMATVSVMMWLENRSLAPGKLD